MCDCYGHRCAAEECEEMIPVHIGDFAYPRWRFTVWCAGHLREADPAAVLFTVTRPSHGDTAEGYGRGWQCAILGPEVGWNGDNCPNLGARMKCEYVGRKRAATAAEKEAK